MRRPLISMNFFSPNGFAPRLIDILLERFSGLPGRRWLSHDEYHVNRGMVLAIVVERRVAAGASMDYGVGHAGARSGERRVGEEYVGTWRVRWSPYHQIKKSDISHHRTIHGKKHSIKLIR